MENNPLSKKAFIDWMDKTYGWQDAQDYSGTFTQDIAIGFATSRVQELEEENKRLQERLSAADEAIEWLEMFRKDGGWGDDQTHKKIDLAIEKYNSLKK